MSGEGEEEQGGGAPGFLIHRWIYFDASNDPHLLLSGMKLYFFFKSGGHALIEILQSSVLWSEMMVVQ